MEKKKTKDIECEKGHSGKFCFKSPDLRKHCLSCLEKPLALKSKGWR